MYIPEIFKEEDKKEIDAIINRNSLATIAAVVENGLTVHHLPLLREAEDRLCGHIALANDLHRHLQDGGRISGNLSRGGGLYLSQLVSQQGRTSSPCAYLELSDGACGRVYSFSIRREIKAGDCWPAYQKA